MLMPHLASDKRWPRLCPLAGAVFFDTGAKRYSSFLDHELRAALFCGLRNQSTRERTGFDGYLHRLACDTQASLVCESEPPLRVAQMPPQKAA